jgi:hypothetical protein
MPLRKLTVPFNRDLKYPFLSLAHGPRKDAIFIHIPRTGGTSIAEALAFPPPDPDNKIAKHYTALEIKNFLPPEIWERAFKFAFVRNPWERLYSHFKYREARGRLRKGAAGQPDFPTWIKENIPEKNPGNLQPQYKWITDENGKLIVDFVGRFDRLMDDFLSVCNILETPPQRLGHLNRSRGGPDYRQHYNSDTRSIVSEFYAEDMARFNFLWAD